MFVLTSAGGDVGMMWEQKKKLMEKKRAVLVALIVSRASGPNPSDLCVSLDAVFYLHNSHVCVDV